MATGLRRVANTENETTMTKPTLEFTNQTNLSLTDRILACREGGRVQRLHTARTIFTQDVAQHCFNMLTLLKIVNTYNSVNIYNAIIEHDLGERWIGDIPAPSKNLFIDRTKMDEFDKQCLENLFGQHNLGIEKLTPIELVFIKSLDLFELWLTCWEEWNSGNKVGQIKNIMDTIHNYIVNTNKIHPDIIAVYNMFQEGFNYNVPEALDEMGHGVNDGV